MARRYLNQIATLRPKPKAVFESAAAFKDELENVMIRKRRSPSTKEPDCFKHAANVLASNPVKNRAFLYMTVAGNDTLPTKVNFHNVKDKDGNLGQPKDSLKFAFGQNRRNADIVLQAASTLARFLERWEHPLDFRARETSILAAVALELTSARLSVQYPKIQFDPPLRSFYSSSVDILDWDSGKSYSVKFEVRPENITNFEVPEIPVTERIKLHRTHSSGLKVVNKSTAQRAAKMEIPIQDRKHQAAIKILRLVLWKYHNKIVRLSDLNYAIEELILKYAAKTQGSRGPYEGDRLYHLSDHDIRPSDAVIRDTDPPLPSIDLVEAQAPSTLRVTDAINSTWMSSGDLKQSWLAGWETAQTVNKEANAARKNAIGIDGINQSNTQRP